MGRRETARERSRAKAEELGGVGRRRDGEEAAAGSGGRRAAADGGPRRRRRRSAAGRGPRGPAAVERRRGHLAWWDWLRARQRKRPAAADVSGGGGADFARVSSEILDGEGVYIGIGS